MTSIRERVLQQIMVELAPLGSVYRSREIPLIRNITPALLIVPNEEHHQRISDAIDRHEFAVKLEIFTRGDPWDSLADPLASQAHRIITQSSSLKALCQDVRRVGVTTFEASDADLTAGIVTAVYQFVYTTLFNDLESIYF